MTAAELRQWLKDRGLSTREAAPLLGLSRRALDHQLYGSRQVGPQTKRIIELLNAHYLRVRKGE